MGGVGIGEDEAREKGRTKDSHVPMWRARARISSSALLAASRFALRSSCSLPAAGAWKTGRHSAGRQWWLCVRGTGRGGRESEGKHTEQIEARAGEGDRVQGHGGRGGGVGGRERCET